MDDSEEIASQDLPWCLAFCFFALMLLAFLFINDPSRRDSLSPEGSIFIEISWPLQQTDVDVWVRDPNGEHVGFSRRDGPVFSLLRDDLGTQGEPDNRELVVGRSAPPGKYLINVHLFSNRDGPLPVKVGFSVIARVQGKSHVLKTGQVELKSIGQERTLLRFTILTNGNIDFNSINNVQEEMQK